MINVKLQCQKLFSSFFQEKKSIKFSPLIPKKNIHHASLIVVIGIMTFLSALTLGSVHWLQILANNWKHQISQEATIQILPTEGMDIEKTLQEVQLIAQNFKDVTSARIVSLDETKKMLEPWLGADFDLDLLPIPRLIIVTFTKEGSVEGSVRFSELYETLQNKIPDAHFERDKFWLDKLFVTVKTMIFIGFIIFFLIISVIMIVIIFATRSALVSCRSIIEILCFIGADSSFIARQFDGYFFRTALKGAFMGGMSAFCLLFFVSFWIYTGQDTVQFNQALFLFGKVDFGWINFIEILALIVFIGIITAGTSHYIISRRLYGMNQIADDFLWYSRSFQEK